MKHRVITLAAAVAVATLAACSEQPQTLSSGVKVDSAPFQGTGRPYADPGWKQGEQASWEEHIKTRTRMGQNDYARVN